MKKKRILKDPDTGEIVGATRTPFSRQAKELNKQIFAEEFEGNRIEDETPEEPARGKGSSAWILLLAFSAGGIVLFLAISAGGIWFLTESEGDGDEPGSSGESETVLSVPPKLFDKESEPESKSVEKNDDEPVSSVSTRVVDESRIQYRGTQSLIFLPNSLSPFSGVVQSFWPNGQKSKEFSVVEGITQGSIHTWYENGQKKKSLP